MKNINFNKASRCLFLVVLTFIISRNSFAQNFVVSGAGSTEVNGTYVPNGTQNGKTKYTMTNGSGTYDLVWECMDACFNWHIIDYMMFMPFYVTNAAESATPPSSGWGASWVGSFPAPTVEVEGKSISYSVTTFIENETNDGTLANSTSTITHNGYNSDFFTGTIGEDFLSNSKATITNLSAGLSATLIKASNTTLTLSISGTATLHENVANSITNLTITFADGAFDQNDASGVAGYIKNDLAIKYRSELHVANSGAPYSVIATAISDASDYDIIKIDAGTYTEFGISFSKILTFKGAGASTTIIQAHANYDSASDRIFDIQNVVNVKFYDLTLKNGKITAFNPFSAAVSAPIADLEFYRCNIIDNIGNGNNGGYAANAVVYCKNIILDGCLISNNKVIGTGSTYGAGIYVTNGIIANNSTFSNNIITPINSSADATGGAVHMRSNAICEITNCTFNGNSANSGGAIYFTNAASGNFLKNTIVYGNTANVSGADIYKTNSTEIVGVSCIVGSSISASGNFFTAGSTVSSSDPLLLSLADNGGETQTIGLTIGSPAIDAGTEDSDVYNYDQRLYYKSGTRDIGAYEYGGTLAAASGIIISTTSGDWITGASWVGSVAPTATDSVTIANTHNITINSNQTVVNLKVESGSTLTITGTSVLTIEGDLIDEGGAFSIASGAQLVVKGDVKNASLDSKMVNSSTNGISIKGNIEVEQ